jgi:glutamate--cysteine ligase
LRADNRRPCAITGPGLNSLDFLRHYGGALGWRHEMSPKGTPRFRLPGQGTISYEPGGQLEFSTRPHATVSRALADLRRVIPALIAAAETHGITLLQLGMDPYNAVENVPLQLTAERYTRMARYFDTIGPAGARMMRQTAALHVNLDFGGENMLRWRVLNAAAPYLTAMFANSSRYAGQPTGRRSNRALAWRELDLTRTGILTAGPVAEDEYLNFALEAPAMLLSAETPAGTSFIQHWATGDVTLDQWHDHLSTMFPDIRPRGYLEVRCIDALPVRWYAAPLVLLAGLLYDHESLLAADDLLGSPDSSLLIPAATVGLGDARLESRARELFSIGLGGAESLGEEFVAEEDRQAATEFFHQFTNQGRSPADFTSSPE